ncbi:hypothetical protein BH24ACT23_BH24ACT23_11310 [soil metagenome]
MPERDQTRINERIGVREVRLVDEDGSQIGVIETKEALRMAQEREANRVEGSDKTQTRTSLTPLSPPIQPPQI